MANNVGQFCRGAWVNDEDDIFSKPLYLFMANNVGQFCLGVWVNDEDDIFSKPLYLLFLIVRVELEMKKIFLDELKASSIMYFGLKEIKHIDAEVTEMWSENVALKLCYVVAPSKHLPAQYSNSMNDEETVGFGSDIGKMIQCLIRGTNELDVVPIGDTDDILVDKLRKSVIGKRYLIVLDDMWDVNAWDDLSFSFSNNESRSRIIVITRLEEVAKQVNTDPYTLPFLKPNESLKLLQQKMFQLECCLPAPQDASQAVAERCKGLPLVIIMVVELSKGIKWKPLDGMRLKIL
ncbi:hypothetical protein HAX54_046409 [Datura stramonium]|uniref:NB-ARC domain-containing protein n=1 Tax=Datura stramonium TaxID=4076 RepID=A0ABS8SS34_DATST|nr:hypothetical protein [Datura stramonium]